MRIPGTTVAIKFYRGRKCLGGHHMSKPFKRSVEITWGEPTSPMFGIQRFVNVSFISNHKGQVYMCSECVGVETP